MAYISNWVRYMAHKLEYSLTLSLKNHTKEKLNDRELVGVVVKNLLYGRITYLHSGKGQEMSPTMGAHDNTLLVRKLPVVDTRYVFVGDAVVLKDPNETNKYLVRRLAALEGSEMVSTDEKEEPFVLEKDQCWVVAENQEMKSKEAYDSRTFGPVSMADIVGRAIYCLRTAVDHGPVSNSEFAMEEDSPLLAVELDVDEMAKKPQGLVITRKPLQDKTKSLPREDKSWKQEEAYSPFLTPKLFLEAMSGTFHLNSSLRPCSTYLPLLYVLLHVVDNCYTLSVSDNRCFSNPAVFSRRTPATLHCSSSCLEHQLNGSLKCAAGSSSFVCRASSSGGYKKP
ncbi:hypothetical protein Rs2_00732 [Raphanus sativus]|nr:hypothetical protein Rs2_00732 [Raphanus sativus]